MIAWFKNRFFLICILIYGAIIIGLSQFLFISDSEFWAWNTGFNFFSLLKHAWVWDRPLFNLLLSLPSLFTDNIWQSLHLTRSFGAFWGIGILFATGLVVYELSKQQRFPAIISILLLMSHETFLSQAYRIRADMLATMFVLLGILLALKRHLIWSVLCLVMALLVTPKSAILVFPILIYMLISQKNLYWRFLVVGALSLFVLVAFIRTNEYLYQALGNLFERGHFNNHFREFLNSWWFWTLLLVSLGSMLLSLNFGKKEVWIYFGGSVYLVLASLLFPDFTPYFMASLLPFLAIVISLVIWRIFKEGRLSKSFLLITIFLQSLWSPLSWGLKSVQGSTMVDQVRFLASLDEFMNRFNFKTAFDGLGSLPHRLQPQIYIGPHQTHQIKDTMRVLFAEKPEVIIQTHRTARLGEDFLQLLKQYYYEVSPGVFVRMIYEEKDHCFAALHGTLTLEWLAKKRLRIIKDRELNVRLLRAKDDFDPINAKVQLVDQRNFIFKQFSNCWLAMFWPEDYFNNPYYFGVAEVYGFDQ